MQYRKQVQRHEYHLSVLMPVGCLCYSFAAYILKISLKHTLSNLLFEIQKYGCLKKVNNRDAKSVAQLIYCSNGCTVITSADDVIYSRLCYPAQAAQLIDADFSLCT